MEAKPRILVIDDDPNARKTLADILKLQGYDVFAAKNGADGIEQARRISFNLALIDLGLPDISGIEVLDGIKEFSPSTAMIIVTGNASLESAIKATNRGAFSYVVKPYEAGQLLLNIKRAIALQEAEENIRKKNYQLEQAQRIAHLGCFEWDLERDRTVLIGELPQMLGLNKGCLEEFRCIFSNWVHPQDRKTVNDAIDASLSRKESIKCEFRAFCDEDKVSNYFLHAEAICDQSGKLLKLMGTVQDISERKVYEEKIRRLAYYDLLTGLPNRAYFKEYCCKLLESMARAKRKAAVLFLDLDEFKRINDTLGHEAGDQLLKLVAQRLQKILRVSDFKARCSEIGPEDIISRLGGDEFILILPDVNSVNDAGKLASRILKEISTSYKVASHEIFVTGSIGISIYPEDGADMEALIKNADTAMYSAKTGGKNRWHFYSSKMNEKALENLRLELKLHRALEKKEFKAYYQPVIDSKTGKAVRVEALVRMIDPDEGIVLPGVFIPLAEETGLIVPIGELVLREACMQNRRWRDSGLDGIPVSVNISCRQFEYKNLSAVITEVLGLSGIKPGMLTLEITESTIMRNQSEAIRTINKLKDMGIHISLDDFGTGYSSLHYLRLLPFDFLKIDKSFVADILAAEKSAAIVRVIIELAHILGIMVIAEGVENEMQADFLRRSGCDEMQGYLFSPPLPPEQAAGFFKKREPQKVSA